jgi:DNA repair protein REV1
MGSRLEQKSNLVRKRIEGHNFEDEDGDEYGASSFGGFPEYFRRKKIKLQNLDANVRANSDKPPIFKGVVCQVNGYTQPSLNDLHTMIVQHGGGFIQYLDGKTMATHIIASNLTPKKKEEFKRYRIVNPAWVVDSIKAGRLLPWDAYRLIEEGAGQKVLGFDRGQMVSQATAKSTGYRGQTDRSWYTSQLKNDVTPSSSKTFKPPTLAQTVTPGEEIEDDEYPDMEITSSVEQALESAIKSKDEQAPVEEDLGGRPQPADSLLGMNTTLQTPPPSSPPAPPAVESETPRPNVQSEEKSTENDTPKLRAREGSQEPDYSMAIVRDSEALNGVSADKIAQMSAEEHNALLLSDPRIRKSTVVNPDFLDQYYRESRLHHLSTWKADLKSQLQALASEKTSSQKARMRRLPGQRRYIMHVDFDSFFAAVSLKKHPQYVDKPAVVAHGNGSGSEIASCNYPARKFGIKNGMWMRRAQELCPDVKILPYDFPGYEAASRLFYDSILATGGVVQSVSIDEALVDISAICIAEGGTDGVKRSEGSNYREQSKADELAQVVRDEVLAKTGCAVSVGIGGNILLAKVALRKAKPAGQYHLKLEDVLDFMGQLEVQSLPGIAWSIGGKLEEIGIKLVKDIRECTREKLINTLGPKTGEKVWDYSRGIDRVEVGEGVVRKSISAEVNWGVRFENQEQVDEFMQGLCGELNKRLLKERVKGRQLTMKVMRRATDAPLDPPKHLGHGKCDTFNKSLQLGVATNDTAALTKDAIAMMRSFGFSPGELRGIGIQMQKLEPIKTSADVQAEGSQRRLQFKTGPTSKIAADGAKEKQIRDEITNDVKTPQKQRFRDANQPSVNLQPATATTPTKKPLNIFGTQFVLPTQVDPKVLNELPEDIRARLTKHIRPSIEPIVDNDLLQRPAKAQSRAESPAVALPNMSQLDPSILEALPEDVRAEILGFYKSPRKKHEQSILPQSPRKKQHDQSVLPQSPRKNRVIPPPKQIVRRKRGGGLLASKFRAVQADNSTLTQSNFVARSRSDDRAAAAINSADTTPEPDAPDPDFLAALPEDIRREILDQQRQTRLQRTGGIDLSLHQQQAQGAKKAVSHKNKKGEVEEVRTILLDPLPAPPTFTSAKLSALPDLRGAIKGWHREFCAEGPYAEDVGALVRYLRDVVVEERDLGKAVGAVKWMGWVVDGSADGSTSSSAGAWIEALEKVRKGVRAAVEERGLGSVDLE